MRLLFRCLPHLKTEYILLIVIFFFALFLRLINLGHMPIFLHQDELMNGYVGRFVLQNGIDLYGNRWPLLYLNNFGDYPNIIPMYLSGAFTYVFGVTAFAVRFPIAVVGSLTIFPFYFLSKKLFKNAAVSLICTGMLAVSPWHFVLSRATAEQVLAIFAFLCGLYFLLSGIERKSITKLLLAAACYASTYLLYPAERVIVPLSLLPTFLLTQDKKFRKLLLGLAFFFLALTFSISRTTWGKGRFTETSIFTFNNQVNNQAFHYSLSSPKAFYIPTRIFDNKLILYANEFVHQYLSYFSTNYLFTTGGHPDRYLVPIVGLLPITELLIVVAALLFPADKKDMGKINRSQFFYILFITALAPLPAALTLDEVPNVHRSALLGVMLLFVFGLAVARLFHVRIKRIPILLLFVPLFLFEFCFFMQQYFALAPMAEEFARYDVRTRLFHQIIPIEKQYDAVVLPREVFALYDLFYTRNFNPRLSGKFTFNLFIPQIGKLRFIDNDCPSTQVILPITSRTLVVDMSQCFVPSGYFIIGNVTHSDGKNVYRLLEPSPVKRFPLSADKTPVFP